MASRDNEFYIEWSVFLREILVERERLGRVDASLVAAAIGSSGRVVSGLSGGTLAALGLGGAGLGAVLGGVGRERSLAGTIVAGAVGGAAGLAVGALVGALRSASAGRKLREGTDQASIDLWRERLSDAREVFEDLAQLCGPHEVRGGDAAVARLEIDHLFRGLVDG